MKPMRLGVDYDTSFLMLKGLDRPIWFWGDNRRSGIKLDDWLQRPMDPEDFRNALDALSFTLKHAWFPRLVGSTPQTPRASELFSVDEVLPKEVLIKLRGHFSNEDKGAIARQGRKRVANILERGASEVVLNERVAGSANPISFGNDALSVDSPTDRLLLEYCINQVKQPTVMERRNHRYGRWRNPL